MQWHEMIQFKVKCENAGVATPRAIEKAIELVAIAQGLTTLPDARLLDLDAEGVQERVTQLAIRSHDGARLFSGDMQGMTPGIDKFIDELVREIRDEVIPELDGIIVDLRPRFDLAVAPLVEAAQRYGFTIYTQSDAVLDLADENASEAFRAARGALAAVGPIASMRESISRIFEVSPTPLELARSRGLFDIPEGLDMSVCFAEGDNWSADRSFYIERKSWRGDLDWLALAAGGLRLNTTAEVSEKLAYRTRESLLGQ